MAFLGDHSQFGLLALAHSSQRSGVMRYGNGCEDLQRCRKCSSGWWCYSNLKSLLKKGDWTLGFLLCRTLGW
jgi:hypothetical protein